MIGHHRRARIGAVNVLLHNRNGLAPPGSMAAPARLRYARSMSQDHAENLYYGGQAVIEGVMIRGPRHMAIAVRGPDGQIITRSETLPGVMAGRLRRIPVVRGMIVLYETLALGLRALTWSSQVAAGADRKEVSTPQMVLSLAFTLVFVAAIFFAGPVLLTGWIGSVFGNEYVEVAIEGLLRLAMLVAYVWLIGRIPEIRRVFAYHGAEHRAIHAYEHGRTLTASAVRDYPNEHPRCGTAFLLTVMVLALVLFIALGTPPLWIRLIERVVLIPAIAAVAYELLRLGQRYGDAPILNLIYRPNLWLQKLTTRDPDDSQIEVAITALQHAIALDTAAVVAHEELADEPLA
jgi:hypothetical protein